MPAASIYTDASACSKLEEKEAQTLEAAIYAKGERQQWLFLQEKWVYAVKLNSACLFYTYLYSS